MSAFFKPEFAPPSDAMIAAAPELLWALENLLEVVKLRAPDMADILECEDAAAIIAKATGGAS